MSAVSLRDYFLPAGKLFEMLNYIDVIGIDRQELAARAGLDLVKLGAKTAEQDIPAIYYSRLYLETVKVMQQHNPAVPWAAGMGTDAYRMLWYYIINSKTLGEALQNAEEFQNAFYRLTGQRTWLKSKQAFAVLEYRFETEIASPFYAPQQWNRSADFESMALLSGLRNWYTMICWAIGQTLQTEVVQVAAANVLGAYDSSVELPFNQSVQFNADSTAFIFSPDQLERPLLQSRNSLEHLLNYALYRYWMEDRPATSTALAIKTRFANVFAGEMPTLEEVAERLHMSPSTLRRRLLDENTSYQQLRNECKEAAAIDYLHKKELKIHEIADRLGFSETSSFVRSFRKWTGMTPKAYRDALNAMSSG